MNSLDFESEESSSQQHEASGWRRLPTAWFHMLCVECIHIYLAVFAWFRLVANVNLRTAMGAHFHLQDHLEGYFYNLFLFGSTTSTSLHLSNVTDTFFLGQEQREQPTVFYNGSMLTLPSTSIDGANIPWIVLVWLLPLGAAFLIILHLVLLARRRVWSFDCGAYLQFSWDIVRMPEYRWSVGLMALAAMLLPVVWILQILMFNLPDQLNVLKGSVLSGLLLLFALDQLAFPSVPCHDWASQFQNLAFRRPFLHLILGSNKSFGLKLVDALWAAELGDFSRLRRYLPDPDIAEEVLRICREVQRSESDIRSRFRMRDGSE